MRIPDSPCIFKDWSYASLLYACSFTACGQAARYIIPTPFFLKKTLSATAYINQTCYSDQYDDLEHYHQDEDEDYHCKKICTFGVIYTKALLFSANKPHHLNRKEEMHNLYENTTYAQFLFSVTQFISYHIILALWAFSLQPLVLFI